MLSAKKVAKALDVHLTFHFEADANVISRNNSFESTTDSEVVYEEDWNKLKRLAAGNLLHFFPESM